MKSKEVYQLKPFQKINHKHYGICTVDKIIPEFGVVIQPDTDEGKKLLAYHSGGKLGTPLLESQFRCILNAL